jgi:hypothetical protein
LESLEPASAETVAEAPADAIEPTKCNGASAETLSKKVHDSPHVAHVRSVRVAP